MIKIILAGIWTCLVTLAACYAAVSWQAASTTAQQEPDRVRGHGDGNGHGGAGVETVRTRMVSVPVIRSGSIQGYVLAQFSFTAQSKALKQLPMKADVVVVDEAFKAIYSEDAFDFRHMKQHDLKGIAKRIVEGSNKRFAGQVVEDVFFQEFSYVTKDGARVGRKGT
jgi:hypothetical protein